MHWTPSNLLNAMRLIASPTPARERPMPDPVNHPQHYTAHPSGIECIQVTEHMSFTLGNAVKYIWRADLKNGIQDLEKAAWYLHREIEKRKRGLLKK